MKKKTKTKKEKPNQLEKLVLNITAPFKMNDELTFQQLSVFVGQNDSGKSFMLKVAFALGAIGTMPASIPGPTSGAQFVFDNTFTAQKFDGLFKAVYTNGSVSVEIKEGNVSNVEISGKTVPVKFMSTDMRTFDQMSLYLRVRQGCGNDPLVFMTKMLQAYRLYDVSYMESLLTRLPLVLPENIQKYLRGFDFKENITSIEADHDQCEFYAILDNGGRKPISTYGKGHQAILNMMIGAQL